MDEIKITKLSHDHFAVNYCGDYEVMNWQGLMSFYVEELDVESEQIEQIIESIAHKHIGETFNA